MRQYVIVPLAERFQAKVDKSGEHWLWTGASRHGYGVINRGRRGEGVMLAHRLAYELTHGPIPDDLWVLHHCDIPACVRPDHLFLGTNTDNVRDMVSKGRNHQAQVTHCPQDHPYDAANTYYDHGRRRCRACRREKRRIRKELTGVWA